MSRRRPLCRHYVQCSIPGLPHKTAHLPRVIVRSSLSLLLSFFIARFIRHSGSRPYPTPPHPFLPAPENFQESTF